jgi:alpha,alpha-trehalase
VSRHHHQYARVLAEGGQAPGVEHVAPADVLTPADRYQELFEAVQSRRIFPDSKTFVDCIPKIEPQDILARYRLRKGRPDFDLAAFVNAHFDREEAPVSHYVSRPGEPIGAHIDGLWEVLTRRPVEHPERSSILPLPRDYIVPGGRFAEMYYWDSYFTMLGLPTSGQRRLLRTMADNFAFLIDTYGHVPNGNRTYYLSRSQPPVFALMVDLFETHGAKRAVEYLPQLRKEYAFWMEGADGLAAGEASRHVVRLPDGALLNRYWDDRETPREEAHWEDVTTAASQSARTPAQLYRELRAAAASGWDFSSRWCAEPDQLSSIRTTAILPVDLNSFLYKLEIQIERLSAAIGDMSVADEFRKRVAARRSAIDRYFWSADAGAFLDYDWARDQPRTLLSAATLVPLYVGLASHSQASHVAATVRARLLRPGGVATTEILSGQQWDAPNGWAPLQWMAVHGLRHYGKMDLSREISHRWLETVGGLYEREWKLVEKYALHDSSGGGGGEYPLQDGFGWTNGVTRRLLEDNPVHRALLARRGNGAKVRRG